MSLTNDRDTSAKQNEVLALPVAAGVKIYAGALIAVDTQGFATPGKTAPDLIYVGRAEESVDNMQTANGAVLVCVRRKASFKWANLASDLITQADFGKPCFIVDDQTVAKTHGGNTRSKAGIVLGVDEGGVWVE